MITPSRTSLADAQSTKMLFIAAECRAQQREVVGGEGGGLAMHRTSQKFSSRAAAIQRLRSIG
jgi:hypothetical protein